MRCCLCPNHTHFSCPMHSLIENRTQALEIVLNQEMTELSDSSLQAGWGLWSKWMSRATIATSVPAETRTASTSQTYQSEINVSTVF